MLFTKLDLSVKYHTKKVNRMAQKTRIRLSSTRLDDLNSVIDKVKEIVTKTGVRIKGPVPLPTRKLKIPTRKSPCGEGTITWEHYEMRIHKRLIDIMADDRSMMMIMKIAFPDSVLPEIELL